jgi:AcrR family transcriptional regulator
MLIISDNEYDRKMARSLRAEQQAMTRDRLLDAATALFATHGLNGTSLADIAEHAGVTTGAIYSNFSTKNDLFAAVVERHMERQANEYRRLYSTAGSAADRLQSGADRWMTLISEQPDYFPLFVEVWRVSLGDPGIRRRLRNAYRKLLAELAALIAEGSPEVAPDMTDEAAEMFAMIITSLADGLAMRKILDPSKVPDDLFGRFLRLVIESIASASDLRHPGT